MPKMKIIDGKNLSIENQQHIKLGNPLFVTKDWNEKTQRWVGKEGRVIWDGKNFIFIPEKKKPSA